MKRKPKTSLFRAAENEAFKSYSIYCISSFSLLLFTSNISHNRFFFSISFNECITLTTCWRRAVWMLTWEDRTCYGLILHVWTPGLLSVPDKNKWKSEMLLKASGDSGTQEQFAYNAHGLIRQSKRSESKQMRSHWPSCVVKTVNNCMDVTSMSKSSSYWSFNASVKKQRIIAPRSFL